MLNINKVKDSWVGLVGFKQPYNPAYAVLDVENTESESGYYVTENTFVKIEYIKDNQDYYKITNEQFNELLREIKRTGISNVCNRVFNEYDFLDRSVLFKYPTNKVNTEVLPLGFVGYKIEVGKEKNISFKINKVFLDFEGTGDLILRLYNTNTKSFLHEQLVTITSDHQTQVLDWVLDNSEEVYKGDFYIGYTTQGLTVQPYKRDFSLSNTMSSFKYLNIKGVSVENHNTSQLFDIDKVDSVTFCNGLNLDITVYDDYTDFCLNNKMLFARAVQLDCIIQCVQIYMASLRSNANQSNSNQLYEKIMIDLEGTSSGSLVKVNGLRNQLVGEITTLKDEIKKLKVGLFKSGKIMVYSQQ